MRHGSWNRRLLEAAVAIAPADMTISVYGELASIPMFNEDLEQEADGGPDAVRQLRLDVASADGLLIATPEYNQSIPGVLKNTIDWLSRAAANEVLAGKPVAIMGASGGRWGTRLAQHALRQTLVATESLVMPTPALFICDADDLFDDSGGLNDMLARDSLHAFLTSLASWIGKFRPTKLSGVNFNAQNSNPSMQIPPLARSVGSAERSMRALLQRKLRSADLSFGEWTAMTFTNASTLDSEQVAQLQVGDHLATDAAEAHGLIDTLISTGLIAISRGGVLVHTAIGAALFLSLSREVAEITHILYGDLPAADLDTTHRTLMEIARRASELLVAAPDD